MVNLTNRKRTIAIVGGGSAALMLAAKLDSKQFEVSIFEKNRALGRKFLVAGDGGFNLTHSEDFTSFVSRYSPSNFVYNFLSKFTNVDFVNWLTQIGIQTFVGSSKRVFPVNKIKPIDVLNAILTVIHRNKVNIFTLHTWKGWNENGQLLFLNNEVEIAKSFDITVFALGGSSWSVTGSDGIWLNYFAQKGINILPFFPSNCAVKVDWPIEISEKYAGLALKNIVTTCCGESKSGELVITEFGLEGGCVYAIIGKMRDEINRNGVAKLYIDLKPSFTKTEIQQILLNRGIDSITKVLQCKLNLNRIQLGLLKSILSKDEFSSSIILAESIKALLILVSGFAPINDAISTVGGLPLTEVDSDLQLLKLPNNYAIGEMLDWDAPTGGFLLQACFSMGFALAEKLNSDSLSELD